MIGSNIRRIRKSKGMSVKQLASYLGVTTAQIYKWEQDVHDIPTKYLPLIAERFGVSVNYLFCPQKLSTSDFSIEAVNYIKNNYNAVSLEIMRYLAYEWNGEFDSMIQLVACYSALPVELRKEVAYCCIFLFCTSLDECNKKLLDNINIEKCKELKAKLEKEMKK